MNRRGFFGTIGKVAAGFMILPGAGRVWKSVVDPKTIYPFCDFRGEGSFISVDEYAFVPQDILDSLMTIIYDRKEERNEMVKRLWISEPPFDLNELRKEPKTRWITNQ